MTPNGREVRWMETMTINPFGNVVLRGIQSMSNIGI